MVRGLISLFCFSIASILFALVGSGIILIFSVFAKVFGIV